MKEHGPEWKYVVVLEEKDILKFVEIRKFQEFIKFIKFEFSIYGVRRVKIIAVTHRDSLLRDTHRIAQRSARGNET